MRKRLSGRFREIAPRSISARFASSKSDDARLVRRGVAQPPVSSLDVARWSLVVDRRGMDTARPRI